MAKKTKNFEESMETLQKLVDEMEKGDLPLEESLKKFEEAVKLLSFCRTEIEKAEEKISLLKKDGDDFVLEDLDISK